MENRIPNPSLAVDFDSENQSAKISLYEQSREERIKKNLQRMQELGLTDLSLKLKVSSAARRRGRKISSHNSLTLAPLPDPASVRRSSRLKNATPVSYSEAAIPEKKEGLKLEEGSKPEVYSEEHAKLLGSTERNWTLFVDGCGNDGRRIYDPVRGKTCHQCRQKTLGYRTNCSKCNMVQGQFCGDCLYMRYGEHVLEAIENPDWICPVCRGICNCSLCRQSKGWAPTGALYRKISKMGYKSVAHYLIQTHTKAGEVKNPGNADLVLAKRSLFDNNTTGKLEPNCEVCGNENGLEKDERFNTEATSSPSLPTSVKKSLLFTDSATDCAKPTFSHVDSKGCDRFDYEIKSDLHFMNNESGIQVQLGSCSKPEQKRFITFEQSDGDISGSERQEQKQLTVNDAYEKVDVEVTDVDISGSERQEQKQGTAINADEKVDMEVTDIKTAADEGLTSTPSVDEHGKEGCLSSRKRPKRADIEKVDMEVTDVNISGSERQEQKQGTVIDAADEGLTSTPSVDEHGKEGCLSSRKRPKRADIEVETSLDSIKGRLRRRPLQINQDCVAGRLRPRDSSR